MKKVKKVSLVLLTGVLSFGFASGALASNGKGKGLETAPGQSVTFSKGVTTEVFVTENVTEDVRVNVETSTTSKTEPKSTSEVEIVEEVVSTTEKHPTNDEYRDVITTTTKKVTTTSTWDETTTVTTTIQTETPVTITKTIETTVQHQGAPGSNGKVISENSLVVDTKEVEGDSVSNETSETTVTTGDITTGTTTEVLNTKVERSGWKLGQKK